MKDAHAMFIASKARRHLSVEPLTLGQARKFGKTSALGLAVGAALEKLMNEDDRPQRFVFACSQQQADHFKKHIPEAWNRLVNSCDVKIYEGPKNAKH